MSARSHLYVPANDLNRLEKALTRKADALIVDLEDGVALCDKDMARKNLSTWLQSLSTSVEIWVRINPAAQYIDLDLACAVHKSVTGIVLPKTATLYDLKDLDQKISAIEKQVRIPKTLKVCALIESAEGIFNAREIATGPRVARLQIGESDLSADIGILGTQGQATMQYARSIAVFASANAGIDPPVAAVSTDFQNLEEYRVSTQNFKQWGYFGRACIHPAQVAVANEIFTPSYDELRKAQDILDRLASAGGGVALDAQGKMIDEAIARIARRVLNIGE